MAQHVLVVLDHHTARIFHLDGKDAATLTVREAAVRETDDRHASDGKRVMHNAFFHEVAGVETIDKPSDPQLLTLAKSRFKTLDTWLSQR